MKSGTSNEASTTCDRIQNGEYVQAQSALAKLRILTLWINRSPQRRQKWKQVCEYMSLPRKYIQYDVENRWNLTYRMLDDSLKAKAQISQFVSLQTDIPSFTGNDWERLSQIHRILTKSNELALFVSKRRPQISLAMPVYYELHDLLSEGSESQGSCKELDPDIASALKEKKVYEILYFYG